MFQNFISIGGFKGEKITCPSLFKITGSGSGRLDDVRCHDDGLGDAMNST
jgi:hypothetical protein